MNLRNTLLLAIIALGIAAYIFFFEGRQPSTDEAANRALHLVNFGAEDVNGLTITNGEEKIELRSGDGVWRMEAPVHDQANPEAVVELLNTLADTEALDRLTPKDADSKLNPKEYGVGKSSIRIKMLGKHMPPEILFGKDAALDGLIYARLEGSDTIYVIKNKLKGLVTQPASAFRDPKLFNLAPESVARVVIKTSAGELDLQRQGAEDWMLRKPLQTKADGEKIRALIIQLLGLKVGGFVSDDDAKSSRTGLTDSAGSIVVYPQGEGHSLEMRIGQAADNPGQVYVAFTPRNAVFLLPQSVQNALALKPEDVRSHELIPILFDEVDRIAIHQGDNQTELGRKQESWVIKSAGDRPANTLAVNLLIKDLQKQKIVSFVDDVGTDLTKYGLDHPQREVVFSSYASANTPESNAGVEALLKLQIGNATGTDDLVYARTDATPSIFTIHQSLLDELAADPVQWQDTGIFNFTPEQITSVQVKPSLAPVVEIKRGAPDWIFLQGDGKVNGVAAATLVNTLSTLHAVRWVGISAPPGAFTAESWKIQFQTSDGSTHHLSIGNPTPDQMSYAQAPGVSGVFLLNQPDVEALQASLVGVATPAPSATPEASPAGSAP
ncbi:MAG: DUF4340 domain-containing protein [Chthoniobacteraceae bacterium]